MSSNNCLLYVFMVTILTLSVNLQDTDGRTDRETDAGNRIWSICDIWWQ